MDRYAVFTVQHHTSPNGSIRPSYKFRVRREGTFAALKTHAQAVGIEIDSALEVGLTSPVFFYVKLRIRSLLFLGVLVFSISFFAYKSAYFND